MYKIAYAESDMLYTATGELEREVKLLKAQGYVEQGGVSISHFVLPKDHALPHEHYTVAQAMVKK